MVVTCKFGRRDARLFSWQADGNDMRINQTWASESGHLQQRSAYTLVEVICSVLIAAIAAAVLFVGFDNGFAILRTTREDMRATQILMQKTEAVRLMTWKELAQCPQSFQEYYYPAGASTTNPGTLYTGTLFTTGVATNIPSSVAYQSNLHLITITIYWTNNIGLRSVPHSRQMQTLSALGGMQNYIDR